MTGWRMSDPFTESPVHNDRFAEHSGIRLIAVGNGSAQAEMDVSDYHLNGLGITNGGAIFTLADIAFAAASNSHENDAVAIHADISFFKASKSGKMIAKATEVHRNRKLATYQIDVFDEEGRLIASMQGTAYQKKK